MPPSKPERDPRKRRLLRVGRVAAVYLAASWLLIEVSTTVFPMLQLPDWAPTLVLVLAALGLIPALVLAWYYQPPVDEAEPAPVTRAVPDAAPGPEPVNKPQPEPTAAPAPPRSSVAVLPFADMSPEKDQEYFGDGIAEEILNVLAKADRLRVPARTSSFAFKGKNVDVREIGQTLGVAAVLEGSIRKSGNRVRVTAQLIEVESGYHLWSERYDRELNDVFEIQDDIAHAIGEALDVRLAGDAVRAPTQDMRAYDYYLRGRQHFNRMRRTEMPRAREMFERAIEVDPEYALAYAGLADTCSLLHIYWDKNPENVRCADEASARAVELDPRAAETHTSRGFVLSLQNDWEAAAAEFERAIALDPHLFEAEYLYGRSCWAAGRLDEAAKHFRRASELRPEDYNAAALLHSVYIGLERTADAMRTGERALTIIERHLTLNPDDARALYLGANRLIERNLPGDRDLARQWWERAVALDPEDGVLHYNVACGYALAGERDKAFEHLFRAVDLGWAHPQWLLNDGDLVTLRDDPRFGQLLASIS